MHDVSRGTLLNRAGATTACCNTCETDLRHDAALMSKDMFVGEVLVPMHTGELMLSKAYRHHTNGTGDILSS